MVGRLQTLKKLHSHHTECVHLVLTSQSPDHVRLVGRKEPLSKVDQGPG